MSAGSLPARSQGELKSGAMLKSSFPLTPVPPDASVADACRSIQACGSNCSPEC